MNLFRKWFGKDYVFIVVRREFSADDAPENLKIQEIIKKELKRPLVNEKLKYADYYTHKNGMLTYYCTFVPKENKKMTPLLFEMHAYALTGNKGIFEEYKPKEWDIECENQTIKIFKLTL